MQTTSRTQHHQTYRQQRRFKGTANAGRPRANTTLAMANRSSPDKRKLATAAKRLGLASGHHRVVIKGVGRARDNVPGAASGMAAPLPATAAALDGAKVVGWIRLPRHDVGNGWAAREGSSPKPVARERGKGRAQQGGRRRD